MTLLRPVVSTAVSTRGAYGYDRGPGHIPRIHQGVDCPVPSGTPIYGSGVGVVIAVINTGRTSGFGLYIIVQYGNETVTTAHMSRSDVTAGQSVIAATVLGMSGGVAGTFGAGAATGPHVHIEHKVNGVRDDPQTHLAARTGAAGSGMTPITQEESDMQPIYAIVQDTENSHPEYYGSMAVLGPLVPNGFQQVSDRLGPRDRFEAWRAIAARIPGVGDIGATMIHVDWAGWQLARDLFSDLDEITQVEFDQAIAAVQKNIDDIPSGTALVDIPALMAELLVAGIVPDSSDETAQKVVSALAPSFAAVPGAVRISLVDALRE